MAVRSLFPILLTRDLPRLVSFYEHALQARVGYRFGSPDEDDYVSLTIGEASLGIGRDPGVPGRGSGDRIALWFYVDDVDTAFVRWRAAGGDIVAEPADMPWGERVAQVRDPDGNLVNLGLAASASSD
ncbi:VOC family protein [Microbacterium flavescens]|jgi:predicted enzyme related to lactoylglutathione lyase|uniref:VOC family protein n=1 Tax=Microbacterium flavescens TaxID=69366 RepID=UPI001BDF3064|nr:VOC family protein [Microbacterium flavescens]BFF09901.1 VOC family protein [Microbacterium flavescens]